MDDPALDCAAHAGALRSLARTNRVLGGDQAVKRAVFEMAHGWPRSVLDLGAGGGGLLERLADRKIDRARTHAINGRSRSGEAQRLLLLGVDVSPQALRLARSWRHSSIRWLCGDARSLPLASESVDVVTCTLTLHHFDPPDAIRILAEAARVCRLGVVFSDLTRSRTAWLATWATTRLVSRSRVFQVDGPRSVRAAFRPKEVYELALAAGLTDFRIRRQFPFRMLLTWRKR